MRFVETNKIVVGQSGLVVVHFTPRFLSGWNRVLVSSKANYTILEQSMMKVVNIKVVAKGLIYAIDSVCCSIKALRKEILHAVS